MPGRLRGVVGYAEENGDIGFSFVAHNNLSVFGFADDDPEAARPHVERQIELDDQLRQVRSGWADCRLAELLYLEGEYRGSLVLHRRVFEWARRQDLPWVLADAAGSAASYVIALESDNVAAAPSTAPRKTSSSALASVTATRRQVGGRRPGSPRGPSGRAPGGTRW